MHAEKNSYEGTPQSIWFFETLSKSMVFREAAWSMKCLQDYRETSRAQGVSYLSTCCIQCTSTLSQNRQRLAIFYLSRDNLFIATVFHKQTFLYDTDCQSKQITIHRDYIGDTFKRSTNDRGASEEKRLAG